jgi:hypothetical protein
MKTSEANTEVQRASDAISLCTGIAIMKDGSPVMWALDCCAALRQNQISLLIYQVSGPANFLRHCPKEVPVFRSLVQLGFGLGVLVPQPLYGQAHPTHAETRSSPALEQFKSLAGEWEGKDSNGKPVRVSYEVFASGLVMERLEPAGQPAMLTMYSLDGDHILATHFCSSGNQPILKTGPLSAATGKYDFAVERVYGMNTPGDQHMVELLITFTTKDQVVQAWTNLDHGKRSTNTISYIRKK